MFACLRLVARRPNLPKRFLCTAAPKSALRPGVARFNVNPVEPAPTRGTPLTQEELVSTWKTLAKNSVEACSPIPENATMLFTENNLLARAVHTAFYDHHPLRLSPDIIWITIAQGFANHVSLHSEELRSKFVGFDAGKKDIIVDRPHFVKGSPSNDWVGVFPEFEQKITEYIGGETSDLLRCDFSTSTLLERTVSQIVLMDTIKSFFKFEMRCGCGIPYIELTGTVEDWKRIKVKAAAFRDFELGWWIDALDPVLDEFIAAAEGNANVEFWASICNLFTGSGWRKAMNGWIQTFFPYLVEGNDRRNRSLPLGDRLTRNTYLGTYRESMENKLQYYFEEEFMGGRGCGNGVSLDKIPSGISKVPFKYTDVGTGKSYDMNFCGGTTAVVQHEPDGVLQPVVGWAVIE